MAFILKSNITVNDTEGRFKHTTPLGVTTVDIKNYYNKMVDLGYHLTKSEFDALNDYQNGLVELGQWDNLLEFAPLIGNTIEQVAVKLKYKNDQVCGIMPNTTNSHVDGKGLNIETRRTYAPAALDLKITSQDLYNSGGAGLISYSKVIEGDLASGQRLHVVGGLDGLAEYYTSTLGRKVMFFINSNFSKEAPPLDAVINITKFKLDGNNVVERKLFTDGVLDEEVTTSVPITSPLPNPTITHYIGAIKDSVKEETTQGFLGLIRLIILHNGQIPNELIPQVSALTQSLITGLGKTIV
jgi:hypothetical protein